MKLYKLALVLLTGLCAPVSIGASTLAEMINKQQPVVNHEFFVVEEKKVKISLTRDEAVMVVEEGGIINTETVLHIVKSMSQANPALNVVEDRKLSSELSSWLDEPNIENLPNYLDKPEIRQLSELHHLKYLISVRRDQSGIEANVWDLKNIRLSGVVRASVPVTAHIRQCAEDLGSWIIGIPVSLMAGIIGGMGGGGSNNEYLWPCKNISIASSNSEEDSKQLGIYLGKIFTNSH